MEEEVRRRNKKMRNPKWVDGRRFSMPEKALAGFVVQDSNVKKVSSAVHEATSCYKMILDEKKKTTLWTSLDLFF